MEEGKRRGKPGKCWTDDLKRELSLGVRNLKTVTRIPTDWKKVHFQL